MGQTRVSSYYDWMPIQERVALEAEVVRRCFARSELQCSFFEFRGYKIIYRRVSNMVLTTPEYYSDVLASSRCDLPWNAKKGLQLGLAITRHEFYITSWDVGSAGPLVTGSWKVLSGQLRRMRSIFSGNWKRIVLSNKLQIPLVDSPTVFWHLYVWGKRLKKCPLMNSICFQKSNGLGVHRVGSKVLIQDYTLLSPLYFKATGKCSSLILEQQIRSSLRTAQRPNRGRY